MRFTKGGNGGVVQDMEERRYRNLGNGETFRIGDALCLPLTHHGHSFWWLKCFYGRDIIFYSFIKCLTWLSSFTFRRLHSYTFSNLVSSHCSLYLKKERDRRY